MKNTNKIPTHTQIVNSLLQEETKIILVPVSLHAKMNEIKSVARVDLQRLTAEALLIGLKKIEKKYIPVN